MRSEWLRHELPEAGRVGPPSYSLFGEHLLPPGVPSSSQLMKYCYRNVLFLRRNLNKRKTLRWRVLFLRDTS